MKNRFDVTEEDLKFINQAIDLALTAEAKGNLPIGALIVLDGKVIATGLNSIFSPENNSLRHAEIEALNNVDKELLSTRAKDMTLYTNVEPCIMCFGTIIMQRIGRVVFGGNDTNKGAVYLTEHLSKIYAPERLPAFVGPVKQNECLPMWERANEIYRKRR